MAGDPVALGEDEAAGSAGVGTKGGETPTVAAAAVEVDDEVDFGFSRLAVRTGSFDAGGVPFCWNMSIKVLTLAGFLPPTAAVTPSPVALAGSGRVWAAEGEGGSVADVGCGGISSWL